MMELARTRRLMRRVLLATTLCVPVAARAGDSGAVQPQIGFLFVGQGSGMVAAGNDSRFPAAPPGTPGGAVEHGLDLGATFGAHGAATSAKRKRRRYGTYAATSDRRWPGPG